MRTMDISRTLGTQIDRTEHVCAGTPSQLAGLDGPCKVHLDSCAFHVQLLAWSGEGEWHCQ